MHAYLMRARMEFRSRVFSSVLPYVSTNFRKNTEESVRLAATGRRSELPRCVATLVNAKQNAV